MRKALTILLVVAVLGGGAAWFFLRNSNGAPQYKLAKLARGNLRVTVNATGTVQPFLQVQVGTQVTGVVQKLFVDFNSKVKKDELVALIDPAPYQSIVDQNKANLIRAQADVGRVKASLTQADKELQRSKELAKRELISPSDLDAAVATYDSLIAQVKVAEATVDQGKATLDQSVVNLQYTKIISPIDGYVISRNADVGQTLSASLAAPTLFLIADEMKKMQVQASVAEADIGRITDGQQVSFTVDAYRDSRFKGVVSQIRLFPTTVQNVVTYTVMIDADNPEAKLKPGMTATCTFDIAQYAEVVKIPNAALRFIPHTEAPEDPAAKKGGKPDRSLGRIWTPGPEGPVPVTITLGATDGSFTQLAKGELQEGQDVIVGYLQGPAQGPMTNPFTPSMGGGQRGR